VHIANENMNQDLRSWRTRIAALLLFACVSASLKDEHDRIESMLEMDHVDSFVRFERNQWLMNVFSVHNYTHKFCLFGSQFKMHLEAAYLAKAFSRGWVSPHFVHVSRNSSLVEDLIDTDHIMGENDYSFITGITPVACEVLFECGRFSSYNDKFISLEQLSQSSGEIDHLLVVDGGAAIIGGQACADPYDCSQINCPTVHYDSRGPRYMEFFDRRFFVKKVTCFPGTRRNYDQIRETIKQEDKVVAVASFVMPGAHWNTAGWVNWNSQWSILDSMLSLLRPSPVVTRIIRAFEKKVCCGGSKYLAAHWRRGDRGHPEMG
jgi:hypothetical protein